MSNNDFSALEKRIRSKSNSNSMKSEETSSKITLSISNELTKLFYDIELKQYQLEMIFVKIKENNRQINDLLTEKEKLEKRFEVLKFELADSIEMINNY